MSKKTTKSAAEVDVNQLAHHLVGLSTGTATYTSLSEYMSAMGRKGGKKGGKRRLETMTPEERSSIARNAALTRWKKKQQKAGRQKG